jgi:hypothetical protein
VNAELHGIRASYVKQAVMLATDLVRAGAPTSVVFEDGQRNNVGVMLRYLRDKGGADVILAHHGLPRRVPAEQRIADRAQAARGEEMLCDPRHGETELGIDIRRPRCRGRARGYPAPSPRRGSASTRAGHRGQASARC